MLNIDSLSPQFVLFIIIFSIIVTSITLLIYFFYSFILNAKENKRTQALETIAGSLGLSFCENIRQKTELTYKDCELFSIGRSRKLKNELWTEDKESHFSLFEYSYTLGFGRNSLRYFQTVLSIQCSQLKLPQFKLEPEKSIDKIGHVFGFQDINFDEHPLFSNQYFLQGSDEIEIREFFNPQRIQYFESMKNAYIESQGNNLILYRLSKRYEPGEIKSFLQEGEKLLSIMI